MIGLSTDDVLRACAEAAMQGFGLEVVQPRWLKMIQAPWLNEDFPLDLLACDEDVLVAVHVISIGPEDSPDDFAELGSDVVLDIGLAIPLWMAMNAGPYSDVRIDLLVLRPMLDGTIHASYRRKVA